MDRRTILLGSLGLAFPSNAGAMQARGKSVCLMIGVEKYDNPRVTSLKYAAKDVAAVASVLQSKFGFTDVRVMATGAASIKDIPTSNNVIKAIERVTTIVEPNDTFVLYFSGHGIMRNGKTYLATQDADPSNPLLLERSTVPLDLLQSLLKGLKSRQVILILDACRNDPDSGKGDSDNKRSAVFSKDLVSVAETVSSSSGGSSAILFACSEGERAYEEEEFGHSVFTKFLLDGLNGKASSFSVDDVVSYASDQVRKWARDNGNKQSPDLHKFGTSKLSFGANESAPNPVEPIVKLAPTAIRLELQGVPTGATIKVDDVPLSGTIYTDEIADKTKDVEVSISATGFRPYVGKVTLTRGSASTLRVTMERKTTEPVVPVKPVVKSRLTDYPALKAYVESLRSIRGGTFQMGSSTGDSDEKPVHSVTLSAFRMGATPVTFGVWKEYCAATGTTLPFAPSWGILDDHPVVYVSWNDIMGLDGKGGFCAWASDIAGFRLTLPTEAQFEYASRGGQSGLEYPWGKKIDGAKLWCSKSNKRTSTAPVTRSSNIFRNAYGLTDMSGNVWQWCFDLYGPYSSASQTNPQGPSSSSENRRCVRGGSWNINRPGDFRCADRDWDGPEYSYDYTGFRLSAGPG